MSVAVSRSDGVTVLTLTSDPSSACPPLCQLLGALCYSPRLCSVSSRVPPQRGGPQAALGALWIITGLLHIGLGAILLLTRGGPSYQLKETYCPLWLGALFIFFGVCCILTERHPRPVFVLLSVLLNLFGVALSITAIVWYAIPLDNVGFYELCWSEDWDYWRYTKPSMSPENEVLLERCQEARHLLRSFSIGFSITLVTLSALDVCLGLSSIIVSLKALCQGTKGQSGTTTLLDEGKATTK